MKLDEDRLCEQVGELQDSALELMRSRYLQERELANHRLGLVVTEIQHRRDRRAAGK